MLPPSPADRSPKLLHVRSARFSSLGSQRRLTPDRA